MKFIYIIPGRENSNDFVFAKREFAFLKNQYPDDAFVFYLNTRSNLWKLFKSLLIVRKQITKNNIQVVHSQYGTLTAIFSLIVSYGCKRVITFRGSDINGSSDRSYTRNKITLLLSWIAMRFSHCSIFVSKKLLDESPHFYPRCEVIPSGVNTDIFFPINQLECRTKLGLNHHLKYVLFYSSYGSRNKRLDLAQGALEYLTQSGHMGIKLFIVDGGIPQELMPIYINAVDAVLMLSDKEGSPTIVQESLACGTPVVSVEVGDTSLMLENVSNSVIVEREVASIARGIIDVLEKGRGLPLPQRMASISLKNCTQKIRTIYQGL